MNRIIEFINTHNNELAKEVLDLTIKIFRCNQLDYIELCLITFQMEELKRISVHLCRINKNLYYPFPEVGPELTGFLGLEIELPFTMEDTLKLLKEEMMNYLKDRDSY